MPSDSLERNKDGVPAFDGSAEKLALFREEALAYTFTLEHHKRYLAGPRLAKELTGVARTVVRRKLAQDPQWLAHPRGAYVLIDFLEQAIETPTLVQASNHIHKFFYQLRRRKGETMTEWINRHSEMMWEASRSLRRVQKEHGVPPPNETSKDSSAASQDWHSGSGRRRDWAWVEPQSQAAPDVFDDNGRMAEDEGDAEDHWSSAGWSQGSWSYGRWQSWDQDAWQGWHSEVYQPPESWETNVPDFLPDFLTGFLLLDRSGLDANERANILAAIRGEFSVKNVEKALREQWRDDDLARRDRAKQYAHVAHQEEDLDDDAFAADMEAPDPGEEPLAYEAFMVEQQEIDQALEAIREKKRTLKEARWRQTQVKLNRRFFPSQPYRHGGRPSSTSSSTTSSNMAEKCLSCGGRHKTAMCPNKSQKANVVAEEAEVAFSATNVEEAMPAAVEQGTAVGHTIMAGKGIIDCGATSTLGSVDAIEQLMKLNMDKCGQDRVSVDPHNRPTFKFGNNGTRECIS